MAGVTIDNLTELTSPDETTNFLVAGGNAQKMKLSTLLSWLKPKMGVAAPDWAKRAVFSSGAAMAADGYVYCCCRASVDRIIQIRVNDIIAARLHAPASTNANGSTFTSLIPVAEGDVVTYSYDVGEVGGTTYAMASYFVPLKK